MPNYAIFEPTPIDEAEKLEPFIKDKVVAEFGAGNGQFALALSQYAKLVIAVEQNPAYANDCRSRGLSTLEKDLNEVSLTPDDGVDVIYFFLSFSGAYAVTRKIVESGWHGTVISRFYPLHLTPGDYWKPQQVIHGDLPLLIYEI